MTTPEVARRSTTAAVIASCLAARSDLYFSSSARDVVDFVKENSYASVTSLAGQPDADAFVASADVVAIAIVDDEDGADALAFRKATACSHTVKKAVTTSAAVAGKVRYLAPPGVAPGVRAPQ